MRFSVPLLALLLSAGAAHAAGFFQDPSSGVQQWLAKHATDGRAPDIRASIASHAAARWFGDWSGDIRPAVSGYVDRAAAAGRVPIVVAYNIPGRDCGQYSKGGTSSSTAYRQWIADFASAVGSRSAVVVLEPDALAQLDCLSAADQSSRIELLAYATGQFKSKAPKAKVYLDIGHDGWLTPDVAAQRLQKAGVANARGFSLNVSNFRLTSDETTYGKSIATKLSQAGLSKTFVVDTSRNGKGPLGDQWCDPAGRRIGPPSTDLGAGSAPEMTLWIKNPGLSDGCANKAGTFDPELAYKLVHGY